jgi:hypothetical protein
VKHTEQRGIFNMAPNGSGRGEGGEHEIMRSRLSVLKDQEEVCGFPETWASLFAEDHTVLASRQQRRIWLQRNSAVDQELLSNLTGLNTY